MSETVAYLRNAAEYAPREARHVDGLRGWWTPDGYFVCARDAARILARGCNLPIGSQPVWDDAPEPYGACCICESHNHVPAVKA